MCCCRSDSEAACELGNPSYCGEYAVPAKFSVHGGVARSPCGVRPGSLGHRIASRDFDANDLSELPDGAATAPFSEEGDRVI
jgi:hypothetical protein